METKNMNNNTNLLNMKNLSKKQKKRLQKQKETKNTNNNTNDVYIPEDCWNIIKEYLGVRNAYYIPKYFPEPKLFKPVTISIELIEGYFRQHEVIVYEKLTQSGVKCLYKLNGETQVDGCWEIQKDDISQSLYIKYNDDEDEDYYEHLVLRPDFKIYNLGHNYVYRGPLKYKITTEN